MFIFLQILWAFVKANVYFFPDTSTIRIELSTTESKYALCGIKFDLTEKILVIAAKYN